MRGSSDTVLAIPWLVVKAGPYRPTNCTAHARAESADTEGVGLANHQW